MKDFGNAVVGGLSPAGGSDQAASLPLISFGNFVRGCAGPNLKMV
jgi:hypothetical protein